MNPQFTRDLLKYRWPFLLGWGVLCFVLAWFFLNPYVQQPIADMVEIQQNLPPRNAEGIPAPEYVEPYKLEWLYVQGNNVLVWPVVKGRCQHKSAVAQYHKGEMVLVIARDGKWVEIESEIQTRLHTHGCIHESMLGPEKPNAKN